MKIAVVYNRQSKKVINIFGTPNREKYGKKSIARIERCLKEGGHQVATFEGDKDLIANLEQFMPRVIAGERPGMVFNLAYGIQGQARYTHVPGILEMVGLPYVGSGPMAHSLALDKVVAKMIFVQRGLPTPEFAVLETPDFAIPELPYPLIVKPRNEAISLGLRIVNSDAELREAAAVIFEQFEQPVLVERFIDGREINVGLLGNNPTQALPPAELDFGDGPKIYTLDDKRHKSGREVRIVCPADLDQAMTKRAQDIARRAFEALGCYDCARVDMRLDADGNFWILEINSLPSLGEHGSYVQGAAAIGLDFTALVNRLVEVASARYFGVPAPPDATAEDSDPGKAIFAWITARRDRIEHGIQEWTARASRTSDPVGLRAAMQALDKTLVDVGLEVVGDLTSDATRAWQTAAGLEGGTLLLVHLDVPLPFAAAVPPFRRDPEWLHGEGIGCSRAPLVILETALRALRKVRRLRGLKLGVLCYTDEGQDCVHSQAMIRAAAARAARVLVLRPSVKPDTVVTRRRGLRHYAVLARGPARRLGHPGKRPDVFRWLSAKLEECCALSSRKERIAVGVGDLRTIAYRTLLPHEVRADLMVGFPDADAANALEERIRAVLGTGGDGHRVGVDLVADRPAMLDRKANRELARSLEEAAAVWDIPLGVDSSLLPSVAGLVPDGTPVLCGLGPMTAETYTAQEAVQRISIVQRTLLLAQFLLRTGEK
jgi:D-alanine-D-alanine ligase